MQQQVQLGWQLGWQQQQREQRRPNEVVVAGDQDSDSAKTTTRHDPLAVVGFHYKEASDAQVSDCGANPLNLEKTKEE